MKVSWSPLVVVASAALASCGGRSALVGNVPGAAGADAAAGAGSTGATGGSGGTFVDPRVHDINAVWPGAGCGRALPDEQILTTPGSPMGYTHFTVLGTGANLTDTPLAAKMGQRTFWVRVPPNYDRNRPYRLVYIGQHCGGLNEANTATYQLFKESMGGTEQAIYVALDLPEDQANRDCYDNLSGLQSQEWEAFQLFQEFVDAHYCVDLNKIYVAGYSTGAWLANQWGCYFSGWPHPRRKFAPTYHIRAQAGEAGGEPDLQPACGGPVAGFFLGDTADVGHPFSGSLAALGRVGRMNGCDTTSAAAPVQTSWHADNRYIGDVCKKFVGCPADYPVVLCTTTGLAQSDQEERVVPAITYFFNEIEAPPGSAAGDGGAR